MKTQKSSNTVKASSHEDNETFHIKTSSAANETNSGAESKEIEESQVTSDVEESLTAARVRIYKWKTKRPKEPDVHNIKIIQKAAQGTPVKGSSSTKPQTPGSKTTVTDSDVCAAGGKFNFPSKGTEDAVTFEVKSIL